MAAKTATESATQTPTEMFTGMQAKALDAFAALAETNQRVLQGFVDLSVTAAREGMRAYAELQSAAVDAAEGPLQPRRQPVPPRRRRHLRSARRGRSATSRCSTTRRRRKG